MTKLILACPHGGVGSAFKRWLAANHPEIDVISPTPFPFQFSHLDSLTRDPAVRYFVNGCGLGDDKGSYEDPYGYFDVNAVGVLKHLEMVRQNGPNRIRYLNLGTIYQGMYDHVKVSPYVASKRAVMHVVTAYRNLGVWAAQPGLGFTEHNQRADSTLSKKVVKAVVRIKRALDAGQQFEPLHLRDIDQCFVWTWAEDVAAGIWQILQQEQPLDLYLGTGEEHSVREFVERAFYAAGVKGIWWDGPTGPEYLLSNDGVLATKAYLPLVKATGDGRAAAFDRGLRQFQPNIGWEPKWTLRDIVSAMVAHELKQP